MVGEGHSLHISTRIPSNAWSLTAVCWCVLGGSGGGAASSWFVLGGHGGRASLSAKKCCGTIGGGGEPSSSLGDSLVSSTEKSCGGIGGGEPSESSGAWGRDVVSTLLETVPGGIIINLSEQTQV